MHAEYIRRPRVGSRSISLLSNPPWTATDESTYKRYLGKQRDEESEQLAAHEERTSCKVMASHMYTLAKHACKDRYLVYLHLAVDWWDERSGLDQVKQTEPHMEWPERWMWALRMIEMWLTDVRISWWYTRPLHVCGWYIYIGSSEETWRTTRIKRWLKELTGS